VSVTTRPNLRAARHRDRRGFAARMDRSSRQLQSRPQRRLPLPHASAHEPASPRLWSFAMSSGRPSWRHDLWLRQALAPV